MNFNAKRLILDLLLALGEKPLAVRDAVHACALFGISENSLRVTLARLTASGMIEASGRGAYRLGNSAQAFAGDVANWRTVEQRLRPWSGDYVAVYCGNISRSDRSALRRREQILDMLGFRALKRDLFIRPDNIEANIDGIRQRLAALGLAPEITAFLAHDFDADHELTARQLWDGASLTRAYRATRKRLEAWYRHGAKLTQAEAARQSFELGGAAIRQVVFDPLLPEPLVDTAERHAFIAAVHRFDEAGRGIWNRFFQSVAAPSK